MSKRKRAFGTAFSFSLTFFLIRFIRESAQYYKPGPGSEMTLLSLQYTIRRCTFETNQDQVYRSALSLLDIDRLTTDEMLPS